MCFFVGHRVFSHALGPGPWTLRTHTRDVPSRTHSPFTKYFAFAVLHQRLHGGGAALLLHNDIHQIGPADLVMFSASASSRTVWGVSWCSHWKPQFMHQFVRLVSLCSFPFKASEVVKDEIHRFDGIHRFSHLGTQPQFHKGNLCFI